MRNNHNITDKELNDYANTLTEQFIKTYDYDDMSEDHIDIYEYVTESDYMIEQDIEDEAEMWNEHLRCQNPKTADEVKFIIHESFYKMAENVAHGNPRHW